MEELLYVFGGGIAVFALYRRLTRSPEPVGLWEEPTETASTGGTQRRTIDDRADTQASPNVTTTRSGITDPKDTLVYLEQRGWEQVSDDPERYVGRYAAGGTSMRGGIERTAAGRRQFFVYDPPEGFEQAAHQGRCLLPREDFSEHTYEIHFEQEPASFGDGIDKVEAVMEESNA